MKIWAKVQACARVRAARLRHFPPLWPKSGICAPTLQFPCLEFRKFAVYAFVWFFCSFIAGSIQSRVFGAALASHNTHRLKLEHGGDSDCPNGASRFLCLIPKSPVRMSPLILNSRLTLTLTFEFRPYFRISTQIPPARVWILLLFLNFCPNSASSRLNFARISAARV